MTAAPLSSLTACELTAGFASREFDPVDVASDVLDRVELAAVEYNAVAAVADRETVLELARAAATRWNEGTPRGPLDGVPVSVKESIPMAGFPRRHGSAGHDAAWPTTSVPIIERIKEAGGIIFATTTMPDFGLLGSGLSSAYGVTRNPWDPAMNTGGSSAGAGVLVAAGVGPVSVGTDMGGSVRIPAAHHGLFGLKPTQGRVAYSNSTFRSAGPLARSVADMEALLGIIGQEDAADPTCLPGRYATAPGTDVSGLRFGIVREVGVGRAVGAEEVMAAERQAEVLAAHGATIVDLNGAVLTQADADALHVIFAAKGLAELHSIPIERRSAVTPAVARIAEEATKYSALHLAQATEHVDRAKLKMLSLFDSVDFIITPVMALAAFPAELPFPDGLDNAFDNIHFTAWFNQTGHPAAVVPSGLTSGGMPVGAQIVGPRFADADVVRVMRLLESATAPHAYPILTSAGVSR